MRAKKQGEMAQQESSESVTHSMDVVLSLKLASSVHDEAVDSFHLALSKCYLFRVYCVRDVVCVLSVIVAEIPQMPRHSP